MSAADVRRARLGGHARAESLTAERRREIASAAAKARWSKPRPGVNKRLSKSPGREPREWSPRERHMLYAWGFRDGAGRRPIDKAKEGLGAYDRGFLDGQEAAREACAKYAKEIGYVPQILRLAGTEDQEP